MKKYMLIFTTSNKVEVLENIAHILLDSKLASCVKITEPIKSYYIWKEKKEIDKEYLSIITIPKSNYKKVTKVILENHNYEVPEIISIDISKGFKKYLDWITEVTEK